MIKSLGSAVLFIMLLTLITVTDAYGTNTLAAARIGAKDMEGTAEFYKKCFGMQEIMRLDAPGIKEVMLNFGKTVEEAKANPNPWVVIMGRETDNPKEVSHLVFYVTDIKKSIAEVKDAGGKVSVEPVSMGDQGMTVGFIVDPAGNAVELIERKAE